MTCIAETKNGRMMYLPGDNIIGKCLKFYGESHFHEAELLRKLVAPGDLVIDAGANIGVLTVPLAQTVGNNGLVVSIEAQPYIFNILCGNLALNRLKNVHPLNRAVAEASGKMVYMPELDYEAEFNFGGVPMAAHFNSRDSQGRTMSKSVSTITIDDLGLAHPRLIKIDVEGMEVMTMAGAIKTIRRAKPILYVEFIAGREEILIALHDLGYKWRLHEPPFYNENNFLNLKEDVLSTNGISMVSGDLLCWHPDNPVEVESPYFIDIDKSTHPRHKSICQMRDETEMVYG